VSERNLIGYGATPPDPRWPGGARLALSFVLNYEEGGERSVLEGDAESES
jgi:allantoinase